MLIGIAGTHGAGKGAVVGILKEYGFIHCSARDLLLEKLKEQGVLDPDRPALSDMANTLREKHGTAYVVEECMKRHNPLAEDVVIESMYTRGEAGEIRKHGGYVLAVDAEPGIRYERIQHRMSETDHVSKDEFIRRQEHELASQDPAKQNARAVMEDADFHIENNGSMEELRVQVDYVIEKMRTQDAR